MSTLRGILESLEKLKTQYVVNKDYEKASRIMDIIKSIKDKL